MEMKFGSSSFKPTVTDISPLSDGEPVELDISFDPSPVLELELFDPERHGADAPTIVVTGKTAKDRDWIAMALKEEPSE